MEFESVDEEMLLAYRKALHKKASLFFLHIQCVDGGVESIHIH